MALATTYGVTESVDEATAPLPPSAGRLDDERRAALERLVQNREQLDPERRALVEEMATRHRIPLPPKQGFTQVADKRQEQLSDLGEAARVAVLPMGGQAAGALVGTALGGPVGSLVGQSIGGVAGLVGNASLGISKPDALDFALTGSAPIIARGLTTGGRRIIPGGAAAEQQIGAEMIRDVPSVIPGSKAATTAAYERVEALGSPTMPVPHLQKAVTDLFDTEKIAKKYGGANPTIRRAVMDAGKTLQVQGGEMPFRDVAVMLKRYRQKTSDLESKGGEVWGAYKDLRRALFDDMAAAEKAGGLAGESVTAQREAMAAAKQQIAKEELTEMLEKYGVKTVTVMGQTFETINPTGVLDKLKKLGFEESVGKQEFQRIEGMLKRLASIPRVDMHTGTGVGTPGRAIAMAGAAALGGAIGGNTLTGFGGALAAYGAITVHDAVAGLMMSDRGRNFLVKLFRANQGRMSERTAQIIQFAATQLEDTHE